MTKDAKMYALNTKKENICSVECLHICERMYDRKAQLIEGAHRGEKLRTSKQYLDSGLYSLLDRLFTPSTSKEEKRTPNSL